MPARSAGDLMAADAPDQPNGSRDLTVVAVAVGAMAVLALAGAMLAPPETGGARGSSYSSSADGGAAAYLALARLGYDVRRSIEPVTVIAADPRSTAIVLASPDEPATNQDRRFIRDFVARGGVVLATGCGGASFLSAMPEGTAQENVFADKQTFDATFPSRLSAGAPQISMAPSCSVFAPAEPYVTLYGHQQAAVVRATRIGDGLSVWWAGPTPLANDGIGDGGNFDLLANTLGPAGARTVLWDEYYHGQRRSLWSFAARTPLPWAGAQALIVGVVAVLTFSRRRAPVRSRPIESRTAPMEFIATIAGLYRRANGTAAAVSTARGRLRRLLLQSTGQPSTVPDARLAEAAAPRARTSATALAALLTATEQASEAARLRPADALQLVQQLQRTAGRIER
jgi:uncharacterized protein DUF4350